MPQLSLDFNPPHEKVFGVLDADERRVLSHICEGRSNAISVSRLVNLCGTSDVQIRQTVKHLVEDHGCLIVSATGAPAGFYFPADRQEFKKGVAQYVHRIASLARRVRAMDRAAYEKIFGQKTIEDFTAEIARPPQLPATEGGPESAENKNANP
jgi:hypothetical protein